MSTEQDATTGDLYTSAGEAVRRVDLDRAAGTPGRFARPDSDVAGYEGVELARAALAGDQAALDRFHKLAGLALPRVTEYSEGDAVRIVMTKVDEKVEGLEVREIPVRQHGVDRAVFQATNQAGFDCTRIDALELVAWILSAEGRAALARRGVAVPAPAADLPAGTLTPEEAVAAARNVGVDLTCGECAAMFYTGYPSAPGYPATHDPSCRTRDQWLLALLDAARGLDAVIAESDPRLRAGSLASLEAAALAWAANECPICGRRGDHEWEELTVTERAAHEAEAAAQGT